MRALDRKLVRDLLQMKAQAAAICLVIASGVATVVMSLSTLESLKLTQETYYERTRFADVFARLKRAPNTLAGRIGAIPGVMQVQTRIVVDVNLDLPGFVEPGVARLISLPEFREPKLNALHLRRGRFLEPGREGEVLVNEAFAERHDLDPGDALRAVINGRRQELRIVGIVLSPEYVIQMSGRELLPDLDHFGVFWIGEEELAAAYDMDGAFNDVTLQLMRGASEPEVLKRLDTLIEPYGGVGAYDRSDQLSHSFLTEEIKGLRGMGLIAPMIFLGVAAFLLNVLLSRLVRTQREEIAALKAFGYGRIAIGVHYLKLVALMMLVGLAAGTAVGVWMGRGLTAMYTEFYKFPVFSFRLDTGTVLLAAALSGVAAIAGAFVAVRGAMNLPPAEAMRPEPPAQYHPTIVERCGLQRFLSPAARMILRKLEREPVRALLSCLGIALAVAVLVVGRFGLDALDEIMEFQFEIAQRQDMTVSFVEPSSSRAIHEVEHLPGVLHGETFRSVPVRMRGGHRSRRLGILGLEPGSTLYRVLDAERREVRLPPDGVVLSAKLAEILEVTVGDEVRIEVMEGDRPVLDVPVTGLIEEFAGMNAYMDLTSLHRMMGEGGTMSGAYLAVDAGRAEALYAELKSTPRVAGVSVKEAVIRSFDETVAKNQEQMQAFIIFFACVIAIGVVYNTARIALTERARELATLRVIGFTRAEVSAILLGELAVITLLAIPLGLLLGYGLAALTVKGFETEMYRFPLVVSRSTLAFAATVTLLAAGASGFLVRRRIDHLDLVSVLKSKE